MPSSQLRRSTRLRAGRLLALAPFLALGGATLAAPAGAATFQVSQCSDSSGKPADLTTGFWSPLNAGVADRCGGGGQVELTAPDNRISETGDWQLVGFQFTVPAAMPNTRIVNATTVMSVAGKTGDPALSYGIVKVVGDSGDAFGSSIPPGDWAGFSDATFSAGFGAGSKFAQFYAQCYGACRFKTLPSMSMRRALITLDDPVQPNAPKAEDAGLLDGTPQQGTRTLRVSASDADSGVLRTELHTQAGALLASTPGAGCSYNRPTPCPQSRPQEDLSVDTTKLTDGAHTLELWTYDAAGNLIKTALRAITVQNGPASAPQPAPGPAAPGTRTKAVVSFKVSSRKPRRKAKVTLSGAVTPAPSKGARVVIEAKKGKKWITAAVVRTRAAGTFTWTHRFTTRGKYQMRARLLGTNDALVKPGASGVRSFRVR